MTATHHLFLSPHLDDAIYSCGGTLWTLAQRGEPCTVLTICAGFPPADLSTYAQALHARWGLPDPADARQMVEARREEDRNACRLLGVEPLYWEIGDCIYRSEPMRERGAQGGGRWLYRSDEAIFGPVDPADDRLVAEMAEQLQTLVSRPGAWLIYTPMTIGNHVDHQLVRRAAEQAFDPSRLRYYTDYPYIAWSGAFERLQADPAWVQQNTLVLSPEAIAACIEAMACYRSQLSTFWSDEAVLSAEVHGLVEAMGGGEIYYTPR